MWTLVVNIEEGAIVGGQYHTGLSAGGEGGDVLVGIGSRTLDGGYMYNVSVYF